LIKSGEYKDPLEFWKLHQHTNNLSSLSILAKKFLEVPASSSDVERMFSISGHIFNPKRLRMGTKLFERLVFLKLNENLFSLEH
jgi:hypothetical protein